MPGVFLTAEWRHLLMVNYSVDPEVLRPLIPAGTELDFHGGETFVSIVAFLMLDTRVLGLPIPFHRNFEEINLRFYVRHRGPEGWRRGVVFVKEIVPRRAIALTANLFYNERYEACPMGHALRDKFYGYACRYRGRNYFWKAKVHDAPHLPGDGSQAQFIAEHYWGYCAQRDGGTVEYQVEHPSWRVMETVSLRTGGDLRALYGARFHATLSQQPSSVFLAEGSEVSVRRPVRIC